MTKFQSLLESDQLFLYREVEDLKNISVLMLEKDYWVCILLDHLFNYSAFKDCFVFKGGTSLSKAYHAIERFSEDIDLILDWRKIDYSSDIPWKERSNTQQDKFNREMNAVAAEFYEKKLVPTLNKEFLERFNRDNLFEVDPKDPMIVRFNYPIIKLDSEDSYILDYIKLEIGPLAEWTPSHRVSISPYLAEEKPEFFEKKSTEVLTVDIERTFWEKITILHKIANFPETKSVPERYSRHLYDVYCMGNSDVKKKAFANKDLLARDVMFKQKFYYAKGAHYETATLETVKLVPTESCIKELSVVYKKMGNMIYGAKPDFDTIIEYLKELEIEIHNL